MAATGEESADLPTSQSWKVLCVVVIAFSLSLIAVSIANVALPSIEASLGASQAQLQWVLAGYALTFGVGLVAAGRAGDVVGHAPLFIAGVALFTASSIVAGLAPDAASLSIARAFQGLGAGVLNPQTVGVIQHVFHGPWRARAFSALGSTVGVSLAAGPLLGGLLIELAGTDEGWRWTFFVNVPVGILAIGLAILWMPKPLLKRNRARDADRSPRRSDLDPVGAVLLGLAVLALLLPFVEGTSHPWVWMSLLAAVALGLLWVWWERRYKRVGRSPMVDLEIFRIRSFANGTLIVTLYFAGVAGIWVIVALYLQDGLGYSALAAGCIGLPHAVLAMFVSQWSGRRVARFGNRLVMAGTFSAMLGLSASMVIVGLNAAGIVSEWWLLLSLSFLGIAQGMVFSPNQAITLAEVPLDYAGSAGGIMQTGQRIGASIGIAVITALAFGVLAHSDWASAFIAGFCAILLVTAIAFGVAYSDVKHRRSPR